MFGLNHFIWLGIAVIIVVGMLIFQHYKKISFDNILSIMCVVALASELIKIFLNIELNGTKYYLEAGSLPFHLCSIQIFFIFGLKFIIKNPKIKDYLLCFMVPTMMLGAFLSLMIPTVGTNFDNPQVYQYFIYHAMLIFFGIYLVKDKIVNLTFKVYLRNIIYLAILALFVLWINSFLQAYDVNFMYLSYPPMKNLPYLNMKYGWFVYFTHLFMAAVIIMFLGHLPFAIKDLKQKRL